VSALDELRSGFSGAQMAGARPQGPYGAFISFSNDQSISFETEANPPHRYVRIGSIGGEGVPSTAAPACAIPQQTSDLASLTQLDEQLRAEAAAETFSGVVLVAKDGKPIFHEAYGYADKKARVLNRKDTKFNLGSINKIFTMVAVYQLLDAGKLNLDDTVGKYLPQFPPAVANKVTVGHLLEHRSGWGAYWENPTWNARRAELRSLDDYMAFIKDIPLDFEPGSRMQYSNTGYEVLGAIVEAVAGQSYFDYVRDNVYEPAGMMATDAYLRDGSTPNMAIGYAGGGYGQDNSSMLSPKGSAAGGGLSTAADLLRFAAALDEGTLLPKKYANRFRGGGFGGGGPGVNAMLELNVAGDHTIVVLSNFDPPTAGRVARQITGMLRANSAAESGGQLYRIGVGLAPHEDGMAVDFLEPGSPGEKGGLKPDDVILAINGTRIADDPISHFDAALVKPDPIKLTIRRGTKQITITVIPEPVNAAGRQTTSSSAVSLRPGCAIPAIESGDQSNAERVLGVLTDAPDARTARAMGLATRLRTEGRVVTGVLSGSPADRAGIRTGDVILELGNNRLYSRDGLEDFIKTARPGTVPVLFKRAGTKTERTVQISLSNDDLPQAGAGIRWQYSGMGQLDEALAAAKQQGKRLLVGLSGSETCCAFSRFEAPAIAVALAGDDISRLTARYVTLIIRRPHAYWFLEHVSDPNETASVAAIPSGLRLSSGVVLPIPSVFVLDGDGEVLDQVALADSNAASLLRQTLKRHSGEQSWE